MFKDKSLNLSGVWRGLTGVINLCPNCYQQVEATARGSMQIQQKKENPFDLLGGIVCSCADTFPDWYKWVRSFTFQCKMPGCSRLQGGGVGGRVNFKPPLSIVGCVSAWFGKSPCKLCIQGFSVHVHKNKLFYHSPTAVQGIYVNIKWNEKWDDKINACLFHRLT